MGLAASQARLLTITARKSDCEFQSMSLSHQKIALSRDMEKVSQDYQRALNQTKLVYDYYGSGTSEMNLDYGILMRPSVYNDYYPKLLTDTGNRIVLNSKYAAAARAAGIPNEGYMGTPSSSIRNAFIDALKDQNIITLNTADTVKSITYNNVLGLGDTFSANQATKEVTYDEFIEMLKANCMDTSDYGLQLGGSLGIMPNTTGYTNYPDITYTTNAGAGQDCGEIGLYAWKKDNTRDKLGNGTLSLYDLLESYNTDTHYQMSIITGEGCATAFTEIAFMQQLLVGTDHSASFLNWMRDQFSTILGGVSTNDAALQYAYDSVYDLLYPSESLQKYALTVKNQGPEYLDHNNSSHHSGNDVGSKNNGITGERNEGIRNAIDEAATMVEWAWDMNGYDIVREKAKDYMGMTTSYCGDAGKDGQYQGVALDLSNITQAFITSYVEYLEGIETSKYNYNLGKMKYCSLYDPKKDDFTFTIPLGVSVDDVDIMAGFYDTLFNQICTHGWSENDKVDDMTYMQEMLKNGSMFISSISNDGCYYQNGYAMDTYIAEIADKDAIALAEAKYNTEKAKIENKENRIDMKMKNLDTEISSLTTEYDTTKTIINKAIEKGIKRYEA